MASAVCRSKFLTNLHVQKVAVLDITESKVSDVNRNNAWNYVISVSWSDGRNTKIYREYSEITNLYNLAWKLRHSDKLLAKSRNDIHIPKVPGRGFFEWSLIKFMIRNQPKFDLFLQVLITLPHQISRKDQILDFFEVKDTDHLYQLKSPSVENSLQHLSPDKSSENHRNRIHEKEESCDNLSSDCASIHENMENKIVKRTCVPPSYLPVTSCFEPNDVIDDETCGYQNLLEDITSLDLYEDYETLYEFPLRNLLNLKNDFHMNEPNNNFLPFYKDKRWLKECEEILSPYSPNKAYFHLVHDLEIC